MSDVVRSHEQSVQIVYVISWPDPMVRAAHCAVQVVYDLAPPPPETPAEFVLRMHVQVV